MVPRMVEAAGTALSSASADSSVRTIRSPSDLEAFGCELDERIAFERLLSQTLRAEDQWELPVVCQVCDGATLARGDWQFSDGVTVNFREHLICPTCELNNRQRFMGHLLRRTLEERTGAASVYLYEQVTPFFAWAERDLGAQVTGSEYLGHDVPAGAVVDGIRHEDALALTFEDETFDLIVSNDVFEHVPDVERSLAECARVLKADGRMLFSIPFHANAETTVKRAELRDGEVDELLPAQYHGNPISTGGSLVFYDYGWDILEKCREAGFRDAYLLGYWSVLHGYIGNGRQLMFVADR
jgi:hypothetical protein